MERDAPSEPVDARIDAPRDAPSLDAPTADAPSDEVDAPPSACTSAADCDDGLFCTTDVCFEGACMHPPRTCPEDESRCTVGVACDEAMDACVPTLAAAGTLCREAVGPCDVEERCAAGLPDCPADGFAAPTVVCGASRDQCDAVEHCTGTMAACPADMPVADGTECDSRCGFETCMAGVCTGGLTCSPIQECLCDTVCGARGSDCP